MSCQSASALGGSKCGLGGGASLGIAEVTTIDVADVVWFDTALTAEQKKDLVAFLKTLTSPTAAADMAPAKKETKK